jgi:hypothetical protein
MNDELSKLTHLQCFSTSNLGWNIINPLLRMDIAAELKNFTPKLSINAELMEKSDIWKTENHYQ